MQDWDEKRFDVIGQNGNDGLHYEDAAYLKDLVLQYQVQAEHWKEEAEMWRRLYVQMNAGIIENIKARDEN